MPYTPANPTPIGNLLEELGARIERYRLSRNLRQEDVAAAAGVSRMTVGKVEKGGGTIETLARVLRALEIEDRLLELVPDARVRPMDARSGTGRERQRARPHDDEAGSHAPWRWGDE